MIEQLIDRITKSIPQMEGWCSPEKAASLARAIIKSESLLTVELGIFGGRGLIAMAMAHQHFGKGGIAWGFDPWTKEAALEGKNDPENDRWWAQQDLDGVYLRFMRQVVAHSLLKECYWARLKSERAVKLFDNNSIGVLHLDANHSEQTSCQDVGLWTPKVKKDGYVFFDDTDWDSTKKAQELMVKKGFTMIDDRQKWAIYQKTS